MIYIPFPEINPLFVIILIAWSLVWKGIALWTAARRNERTWFIALLVVNTLGLLEIFYIYGIALRKNYSDEKTE